MNDRFRKLDRKDFYDGPRDLPRLPEGADLLRPYDPENPIAVDIKTGVHYQLKDKHWELADKE